MDVNPSPNVRWRLRLLRYFGLTADPTVPVTLHRPIYGRRVWLALVVATSLAAVVALRVGGASWASVWRQLGVDYNAGLVGGVGLPLMVRRGSRKIQIMPAEAHARVTRSRLPWLKIMFITLSIVSAAFDHSGGLSVMLLAGMWLGTGVGNEFVHRRVERRAGFALYASSATTYHPVTDPGLL